MTEAQSNIENLIRKLESEDTTGYASWPLPCSMDKKLSALMNMFISLTPDERTAMYSKVKETFLFLAFSERMAVLAVREKSEQKLFEGLIAHVIEDFSDYREHLLVLSLHYHSASKIGVDPVPLFHKAATFASPKSINYLLRFAHKPSGIRSMGYREVMTSDGFGYERTW